MTPVRTAAGLGVGTALLSVLAGCSSDSTSGSLSVSAPITAAADSDNAEPDPSPDDAPATAPLASLFAGEEPVSVVTWWEDNEGAAPTDLQDSKLLVNEKGSGPQRFPGPDMRKYDQVLLVITCTEKAEYLVRLQVLDGLSVASTTGPSCGGPELATYTSPPLEDGAAKTEVEVEVPEGTDYYVTLYGSPVG